MDNSKKAAGASKYVTQKNKSGPNSTNNDSNDDEKDDEDDSEDSDNGANEAPFPTKKLT